MKIQFHKLFVQWKQASTRVLYMLLNSIFSHCQWMEPTKEELIQELKQVKERREKLVAGQNYEQASIVREREKEILKQLEERYQE